MRLVRLTPLILALLTLHVKIAGASDCAADQGALMKAEGQATGLTARISVMPATIPVGSPFAATVVICGAKGQPIERFTIDATMPRHRHGMNYQPKVLSGAEHTYKATGLFFHMPGLWRFEVTLQVEQKSQRFTYDVDAK